MELPRPAVPELREEAGLQRLPGRRVALLSPAPTFIESLDSSDREALLAAGRVRRWGAGEPLVRLGDPAESAILLTSGLVKVHRSTADGAEVMLGLEGPGALLGEISAVGAARRSADATALEEIEARVIEVAQLRRLLLAHPRVTIALLELSVARLRLADTARLAFAASDSLGRVTSRLIELAERFGTPTAGPAIEVGLPITQDELASWSASSRESTARSLRTLRQLGLIETRRLHLVVHDLERLRDHAARL